MCSAPIRELIDALSFLFGALGDGQPHRVRDLRVVVVRKQDFSWKTLRKAKRMLEVVTQKRGRRDWTWTLPL